MLSWQRCRVSGHSTQGFLNLLDEFSDHTSRSADCDSEVAPSTTQQFVHDGNVQLTANT